MPLFSEKLRRLMRVRGETTRSLGAAVDVTSGAVTGWTKGAEPRPDAAKRLADHFKIPVEVLLDDTRDLPGMAVDEAQSPYLVGEKPPRSPQVDALLKEFPPGTKWGDLTPEQRGRVVTTIGKNSPHVRALIYEFMKLAPAIERGLEIIRKLQESAGSESSHDLALRDALREHGKKRGPTPGAPKLPAEAGKTRTVSQ